MSLINDLEWRYATKKMNGQIVPQEKIDYILEAARLTASSSGLQPYEVFLLSGKEAIEKILPAAMGNNQVILGGASNVLVFAAWDNYTEERIANVFSRTTTERGIPANSFDAYKTMLWGMYSQQSAEQNHVHATKQAYIALGTALIAAAEQKVDTTPMEGINFAALDEILQLKEKGLKSVVVLPLGYRDEPNDYLVKMKKVRTPKEQFVTEIA